MYTAGVTWSMAAVFTPWAARSGHTTVIDAAGTMYLIGGNGDYGNLNDVWSSADKGANRRRGTPGGTQGGTQAIRRG